MFSHETETGFEFDPEVYKDLLDQITYAFDDAFSGSEAQEGKRTSAEFIQTDTYSIRDADLISALLTENGGKPDIGVEKIRILARTKDKSMDLGQIMEKMHDPDNLPFDSKEYFIEHQNQNGEKRFSRVDEKGIYPWVPYLRDIVENNQEYDFAEQDIIEAILHSPRFKDVRLEELDYNYAKELIEKIAGWPLVPQN